MGDATVEISLEKYDQLRDDSTVLRMVIDFLTNDTSYSTADTLRMLLGIADPNKEKAETAATETANKEFMF